MADLDVSQSHPPCRTCFRFHEVCTGLTRRWGLLSHTKCKTKQKKKKDSQVAGLIRVVAVRIEWKLSKLLMLLSNNGLFCTNRHVLPWDDKEDGDVHPHMYHVRRCNRVILSVNLMYQTSSARYLYIHCCPTCYTYTKWDVYMFLKVWEPSTSNMDKAGHLTVCITLDSSFHLPVTLAQLLRPGIGWN